MYDRKELNIIKTLIKKEIKEQYFNLGMAKTELSFSINNIEENGEGHKPFKNNITTGEFKKMAEDKVTKIKNELKELSSLCFKTNEMLGKINDSEKTLQTDTNKEEWDMEI
ncbi:hypothetical protein [Sporanaerobacter acetigenes]|uniref:Uncharacterized protein n=1 Tax=Sporanaerobacter acetigenes DSM 13106 TaxID=1123281 RepID=A0A1M5UAQ2_9FIRM|nr:hypothetical protein [Sporanaerobacter acetigenes]SHH59991.1 hypothetical protein SAMN02745180_00578 [Sporanaerobacter acetigenes DSM 13106]